VSTTEEERFIRDHRRNVAEDVGFFQWDIITGWNQLVKREDASQVWVRLNLQDQQPGQHPAPPDPHQALRQIFDGETSCFEGEAIFFMKDFHKYFKDITVVRRALSIKEYLKGNGKMIVFVSPITDIPIELRNDITVVDFDFPNRDALQGMLEKCANDNEILMQKNVEDVVDSLMGFTAEAAENALSFSVALKSEFHVRTILDLKSAYLKAGGVLEYGKFKETLDDLYGLEYMKKFVLSTIKSPKARGVLIYGVPGCGKSHFAKALANEVNRALLVASFSAVRSKYQGEAESKLSDMFKTIEAFGKTIVFVDELEKAIKGSESGDTDGGVGSRILGDLLVYLQDREPGRSYWIATCNSLDDILHMSGGALLRRFDALFFVDMPTKEEAKGIAKIWNRLEDVEIPMDWNFEGYTGADIAKLAMHMSMMGCGPEEAEMFLNPYGRANKAELNEIRNKATGTCIWASKKDEPTATKRKVTRIQPGGNPVLN
jgi:hypothetical protein